MAGFQALADKLAGLSRVPSKVPAAVATALNDEIRAEFGEEADPYGHAWAPLKASTVQRKGNDRIMVDTNKMLAETKAVAVGDRIEFHGTDYGPIHQKASANRAARPAIPNEPELPATWQKAIADEFHDELGKALT